MEDNEVGRQEFDGNSTCLASGTSENAAATTRTDGEDGPSKEKHRDDAGPPEEATSKKPDGPLTPEPAEVREVAGIAAIREQLENLQTAFDEKLRFDSGREQVIDRMHAELQDYKNDLVLKALRPMALGLIQLYDDLGRALEPSLNGAEVSVEQKPFFSLLAGLQADVEELLNRSAFESFIVPSPSFDPKQQRAVRRVPTEDQSADRSIAERLRKGFIYEGKVVRPELVAVYVYEVRRPAP